MFVARLLVFVLVAGLGFLASTGCGGSNTKGKIEGKWKFVSEDTDLRDTFLLFGDDGTVRFVRPPLPQGSPGDTRRPIPPVWHYKLLAGDAVDFYDLSPYEADRFGFFPTTTGLARVNIRIETTTGGKYEGREMTVADTDGKTIRLIWVR